MKKLDPMYWILRLIVHRFSAAKLQKNEREFVDENINKHRLVLWLNLLGAVVTFFGLRTFDGEIINLIAALLAPVMVMGTAWFGISFGAVPAKLIDSSMSITFWMFLAFMVSFSAMMIALGFISPPLMWPVYGVIYVGAVTSCIQYDTADGLKAGLDEALMKHSRAALIYYQKQGIMDEEGGDQSK